VTKTDVVIATNVPRAALELRGPLPDTIDGDPLAYAFRAWTAPSGNLRAGIWECTPGSFPGDYPDSEWCYLISGRVTLTATGSDPVEAGPGTMIFFPAGWQGTWQVHETVRKVFVAGALK
jgi:hypothetical protein